MIVKVKIADQEYKVEIYDLKSRPVKVTVDGEPFEVWLEDVSLPQEKGLQGFPDTTSSAKPASAYSTVQPCLSPSQAPGADRSKAVLSPIPGVILSISVKAGDFVKIGQELCVLEAMKMKNILRASRDGNISRVLVSPQEHVSHGQVLMEYSD